MLERLFTLIQRDRRYTVAALFIATLLFGAGYGFAQHAINVHQGAFAMLGVLLALAGLAGQLAALAALFRQR
jgi:hypothetical protein